MKKTVIYESSFTIDGIKEHHDYIRSTLSKISSFDTIISACDLYLKLGFNTSISTNVCRDNIEDLSELFQLYQRKGWTRLDNFHVSIARVFDRYKTLPNDYILYEAQILEKIMKIFDANKCPEWLQASFFKTCDYISKEL